MRILIFANNDSGLYSFRREVISAFIAEEYEVFVSVPKGSRFEQIGELGCKMIDTRIDRRGTNPITDSSLAVKYIKIINNIKPDVICSYTVKPNIYGGIVASLLGVPYIANITGLGSAAENPGALQKVLLIMYKIAFRKISCVFFQNEENMRFFKDHKIAKGKHRRIPGSGVNLKHFSVLPYPSEDTTEFVFISRIMKEKGIEEYLDAAKNIRSQYPNTVFHICGSCEEDYESILKQKQKENIIIYHGGVSDVREIISKTHCTIHPSYHEGMSNVLLESSACGRPCLCSNIPGCREIVENYKSGFLFEPKNEESLIEAIEKFLVLSYEEQRQMGLYARQKVEKEFNRQIIVDAYIDEINKIMEKKNE